MVREVKRGRPRVSIEPNGRHTDPTENVKDLTAAGTQRSDDLQNAYEKFTDMRFYYVERIQDIRAKHRNELNAAEAKRIDSRQADIAVMTKTEADRSLQAIQALERTTAANAENLRNALTSTATTIAKQQADTASTIAKQTAESFSEITTRIAALERSSYEGKGKQIYAEPAMEKMMQSIDILSKSQDLGSGGIAALDRRNTQSRWIIALIVTVVLGMIGTAVSILGMLGTLFYFLNR